MLALITWTTIACSATLAVILLLVTGLAGGLAIAYLPADYFVRKKSQSRRQAIVHWAWLILRNLAGLALIGLGVLMLVLPGPGILTIVIGLLLLSFPGKRALVGRLIRRSGTLPAINRWRARFKQPPLELK